MIRWNAQAYVAIAFLYFTFCLRAAYGFDASRELGSNDEDMIVFFNAHKSDFENIVQGFLRIQGLSRVGKYAYDVNPTKLEDTNQQEIAKLRGQMRTLQLDHAMVRDRITGAVFFGGKGFGTYAHGIIKGFSFQEKPPTNIVADLDLAKEMKRRVHYYRVIEGHWYLYILED